jgi:hypothetical protein
VQQAGQRATMHQRCEPAVMVRAAHHGLRVELAGQSDERVRHRHIIGHCQAISLQTGLPCQRCTMFRQPLRIVGSFSAWKAVRMSRVAGGNSGAFSGSVATSKFRPAS